MKGKMWRVIKTMYNSSRSAVLLEGEKSSTFSVEQGVAQGCSLSPTLFSVFISDLLEEIDIPQIGIQLKSGNKVSGLLFADDFVGITESSENLQQLIDIIYEFCSKWFTCKCIYMQMYIKVQFLCLEKETKLKVSIISNRYINLSARHMLLLSVLRPNLEYGSEVWEDNKSQAASLESIMLGGAKRVLG